LLPPDPNGQRRNPVERDLSTPSYSSLVIGHHSSPGLEKPKLDESRGQMKMRMAELTHVCLRRLAAAAPV